MTNSQLIEKAARELATAVVDHNHPNLDGPAREQAINYAAAAAGTDARQIIENAISHALTGKANEQYLRVKVTTTTASPPRTTCPTSRSSWTNSARTNGTST